MSECQHLWERFLKLSNEMETVRVETLNGCSRSISGMMRSAFHDPVNRGAALEMIYWIPAAMRAQFLPELMELASYANKYTEEARKIILGTPRWTIDNIRAAYDPLLRREAAQEEEFVLILSLVKELDESLAEDVALRAKAHHDPGVQKLGTAYLQRR